MVDGNTLLATLVFTTYISRLFPYPFNILPLPNTSVLILRPFLLLPCPIALRPNLKTSFAVLPDHSPSPWFFHHALLVPCTSPN